MIVLSVYLKVRFFDADQVQSDAVGRVGVVVNFHVDLATYLLTRMVHLPLSVHIDLAVLE